MKIKMPNGVILECDNDFVNEQRLLNGGVEVVDEVKPAAKKKAKSETEEE